ncbi:MAG TPA: hypothetical protein PKO09_04475 [Anaerolineae bacterium]|nr:hypothetical protein [Anaerolineae bacterium]
MITPAGRECRYYYADYFRGRETKECRLVGRSRQSGAWTPVLCRSCPVPSILAANACPNLVLEARVVRGLLGLTRKVRVLAVCSKHLVDVKRPHVGCGHCNEERQGAELLR